MIGQSPIYSQSVQGIIFYSQILKSQI